MTVGDGKNIDLPVDIDNNCGNGYPKQLFGLRKHCTVFSKLSGNQDCADSKNESKDYSPDHDLKRFGERQCRDDNWERAPN